MAKLSKEKLKCLIKECLVEILLEGSGLNKSSIPVLSNQKSKKNRDHLRVESDLTKMHSQRLKAMDNITFKKRVNENVNALTEDPMMSEIFRDTALNTLQEQMHADTSSPASSDNSFPTQPSPPDNSLDVFADSAKNWATLAFSSKKLS